jgi:elongation factor P
MGEKIAANKLFKDDVIIIKNNYFKVLDRNQTIMGRGGGIVKLRLKNLSNSNTINLTLGSDREVEFADFVSRKGQYLYSDNDNYYFMDKDSYEQYSYQKKRDLNLSRYLKENLEVDLNLASSTLLNVSLPIKMSIKVIDCPPNEKGDTASGATKQATLETGAKVNVPLFIKIGDDIIVNTSENEYVERVRKN